MTAKSDDHDRLEEHFFSRPPPPVVHEIGEVDWHAPPAMSRGQRSAMMATVGMLGFTLLAVAAFSGFGEHFMVKPVELAEPASPGQILAAVTESRPPQDGMGVSAAAQRQAAPAEPGEPTALTGSVPTAAPGPTQAASEGAGTPATELAAPLAVAQPASDESAAAQPASDEPRAAMAAVAVAPQAASPSAFQAPVAPTPQAAAAPVVRKRAERPAAATRANGAPAPRRTSVAATSPRSAEVNRLIQSARRDFDQGDPRAAQRKALEAIALDPTRGYAYILLGGARDALGNPTGAQAAYRDCARQATDRQAAACKVLAR